MLDLTWGARPYYLHLARRTKRWAEPGVAGRVQQEVLRNLLRRAAATEVGRRYDFARISKLPAQEMLRAYRSSVPVVEYEDIREQTLRMVRGEKNVLWSGKCRSFAQSSGTSGGRSKYIPITRSALYANHFGCARDAAAFYLAENPHSHLFSGKAFILGGSFANTLDEPVPPGTHVGDLSATLIDRVPPLIQLMRTPSKEVALMADWHEKLPLLVEESMKVHVTSLSGVPSWFLIVLRKVLEQSGKQTLQEVWPHLEVFFHGGISFAPYRSEYEKFTDADKMHFRETYNASEGFFAAQDSSTSPGMLLLLDRGVYFEFAPMLGADRWGEPVSIEEVEEGKVYSLIISSCNGLWRYSVGDTVRFTSLLPPRIVIQGRTHSFINAFGEELMEANAEEAMASACRETGAVVAQYTAGPVYAADGQRGHHRWLIEFAREPKDLSEFMAVLDTELQRVNSDYQAKRSGSIFLDAPEIRLMPHGYFSEWLSKNGNGKLGGQRKIPRLCATAASLARFE